MEIILKYKIWLNRNWPLSGLQCLVNIRFSKHCKKKKPNFRHSFQGYIHLFLRRSVQPNCHQHQACLLVSLVEPMDRSVNLLDLALGLDEPSPLRGKVVLIEDCVETSGSFVLHQMMKRLLSPHSSDSLIFLAFARPFSHYDRVLRKLVIIHNPSFFLFFSHCLTMLV